MLPMMLITVLISSICQALANQVFSVQGFPCHPVLRKCLSFSFRLNPGHQVDNWSNFNRLWWKWRKILKLGFGCWKMTLSRVKMSFWGQRKSSQGQNHSFWPFPPISQKSKIHHHSCRFVVFKVHIGEPWAPSSLTPFHRNITTRETCSIYQLGCSQCIQQVI